MTNQQYATWRRAHLLMWASLAVITAISLAAAYDAFTDPDSVVTRPAAIALIGGSLVLAATLTALGIDGRRTRQESS